MTQQGQFLMSPPDQFLMSFDSLLSASTEEQLEQMPAYEQGQYHSLA